MRWLNSVSGQSSNFILVKSVAEKIIKYLNYLYLNARSVNNKVEEIADFIADRRVDLCFITESRLSCTGDETLTLQTLLVSASGPTSFGNQEERWNANH